MRYDLINELSLLKLDFKDLLEDCVTVKDCIEMLEPYYSIIIESGKYLTLYDF